MSNFPQTNNNNVNNNNLNNNNNVNSNLILQTLKRRANKIVVPLDERVTLERVYGFTSTSNTRVAQNIDGTIAYLAGCVIVLYHPGRPIPNDFIISQARKNLTTVAFSNDGRSLATGESGHDPKVRVWDVRDKVQIAEFSGHKFSIECVYFSPNINSNLLVSIGSQHDMVVNVWNLKSKFKAASNKISCKVKGISFARDGSYFVTVGNRHVKFWYLTTSSLMETVPLKGRAAILGEYKNNYFCDVVCGSDDCTHLTYALTSNGILCEFNENRYLSHAIDLRTENAYCIYADNFSLFVGCSNGNIHIFKQNNLEFLACLPRPHYLGVDVAQGIDTRHVLENINNPDLKYPDCVALSYNKSNSILTAVYNDHSIYTWDIRDISKVKKLDSHLFHSSCVSALDIYTHNQTNNLPLDSFITCSTDNTLRIWSSVSNNLNYTNTSKLKTNIYSRELLKIIYIDNDLSGLCDIDTSLSTSSNEDNDNKMNNNFSSSSSSSSSGHQVTNLPSGSINNINLDSSSVPNKLGARCLKINPFGTHLATGDRNGNIRIYDLECLEFIGTIEAHDCEILCLQYSQPESGKLLLASSSRDRLIHIFDASNSAYSPLQTIDDHSSSIAALRFCFNPLEKQLYLISCGNDKSIMFRTLSSEPCQFTRTSYAVEKQTFHDLNIDNTNSSINTISQDRMIRTYSIKDGKRLRQFRGSLNEDGHLLKMDTDRNGNLLAASCTDKCVYIWDLNTSECVGYIYGHAEVVADLKFTSDNQHLITVSGDGCIFVWRLNNLVNNNPCRRSVQQNYSHSQVAVKNGLETIFDNDECLPTWARNKLGNLTNTSNPSQVSMTTVTTSIEQTTTTTTATRRSRAVWGPSIDTSFAVMSESELNSVSLTQCTDDDEIQFPSPCVDKDYFRQVKLDSELSRRMSWAVEEDKNDDEDNNNNSSESPSDKPTRLSSTVLNSVNLTFRKDNNNESTICSSPKFEFTSDFSNILNPDSLKTPLCKNELETDSSLRRQSLSARYLMKTQQLQTNSDTPVTTIKPEVIPEIEIEPLEPKKKNMTAHTESSLSKTRTKSISGIDSLTVNKPMRRSPSASSLSNDSRSSINSIKNTKSTSAKSSPQRPQAENKSQDETNLKKALSMMSLPGKNAQVPKRNTILLPPKTMRQVKQRSIERQLTSNVITSRQLAPATTFIEQNKHLRKLSSSIQNISQSGLSLLQPPGSNLPPQAPRSSSKSPQFQLSPKKIILSDSDKQDQMMSSTSSSTSSQNEENNLRESSLSSSSSSSCSIYEQAIQLEQECESIKKKLLPLNNNNNLNTGPQLLNRSADFCQSTSNQSLKLNSLSLNSSPISQNFTGFKKPVTFASLAAAASNSNNLNILLNNSANNNSNSQNSPNSKQYSSEKVESILYEFKQNMIILDLIYNQVSKNVEDFKKLHQTANLINPSQTSATSAQTLQIIQTFNTSIYSVVKQFKAILSNQNLTTQNTTSNSNLDTKQHDADLEYV
ncbi:unnamed protein product [Brachionus calyciflorus]|uniref:MABP1/WDR62 second WD40 domain-containing protein n=1 Tax=Brachionus calyciflorus TaxID=104777 RepID=A0A813PSK2_9BILA|nr:unnamed protein product [Brachionus calyciflorus]